MTDVDDGDLSPGDMVTVDVRREHIEQGGVTPTRCPLALALEDAGVRGPVVGSRFPTWPWETCFRDLTTFMETYDEDGPGAVSPGEVQVEVVEPNPNALGAGGPGGE